MLHPIYANNVLFLDNINVSLTTIIWKLCLCVDLSSRLWPCIVISLAALQFVWQKFINFVNWKIYNREQIHAMQKEFVHSLMIHSEIIYSKLFLAMIKFQQSVCQRKKESDPFRSDKCLKLLLPICECIKIAVSFVLVCAIEWFVSAKYVAFHRWNGEKTIESRLLPSNIQWMNK